jgi:hypothetical protein
MRGNSWRPQTLLDQLRAVGHVQAEELLRDWETALRGPAETDCAPGLSDGCLIQVALAVRSLTRTISVQPGSNGIHKLPWGPRVSRNDDSLAARVHGDD